MPPRRFRLAAETPVTTPATCDLLPGTPGFLGPNPQSTGTGWVLTDLHPSPAPCHPANEGGSGAKPPSHEGQDAVEESRETIYQYSAPLLDGRIVSLDEFRGRVLLITNTASQCGLTPQYTGLERLYRTYHRRGFDVLAFPCNQFGAQEPGTGAEIAAFCQRNYEVSFPVFSKIDVNGPKTHPLFTYLKSQRPGFLGIRRIQWNFTKFLVNRTGTVTARFAPRVAPESFQAAIEQLLNSEKD